MGRVGLGVIFSLSRGLGRARFLCQNGRKKRAIGECNFYFTIGHRLPRISRIFLVILRRHIFSSAIGGGEARHGVDWVYMPDTHALYKSTFYLLTYLLTYL